MNFLNRKFLNLNRTSFIVNIIYCQIDIQFIHTRDKYIFMEYIHQFMPIQSCIDAFIGLFAHA